MAWQLIYTSSPHCLKAGQTGFGTVARHREIRDRLVDEIERGSSYERAGGLARSATKPWIASHRIITIGSERYHVLSSIKDCGHDYSGRTNHIAHHLICEEAELGSAPGPAAILLHWRGWCAAWHESPRYLGPDEVVNLATISAPAPLPAITWSRVTGDAGHAALLYEQEEISVAVASGDERLLLELFSEAAAIAPTSPWDMTFTTFLKGGDKAADFRWKGAIVGSTAASRAEAAGTSCVDLTRPLSHKPSLTALADHARTGLRPRSGGDFAEASVLEQAGEGLPTPQISSASDFRSVARGRDQLSFAKSAPRISAKAWAEAQAAKDAGSLNHNVRFNFRVAGMLAAVVVIGLLIGAVISIVSRPKAIVAPVSTNSGANPTKTEALKQPPAVTRDLPAPNVIREVATAANGHHDPSTRKPSTAQTRDPLGQPTFNEPRPPVVDSRGTPLVIEPTSEMARNGTMETNKRSAEAQANVRPETGAGASGKEPRKIAELLEDKTWLPKRLIVIVGDRTLNDAMDLAEALESKLVKCNPPECTVKSIGDTGKFIIYRDIATGDISLEIEYIKAEKSLKMRIKDLNGKLWLYWRSAGSGESDISAAVVMSGNAANFPILPTRSKLHLSIDRSGISPGPWAETTIAPGFEFLWCRGSATSTPAASVQPWAFGDKVMPKHEAQSTEADLAAISAVTNLFAGDFSEKMVQLSSVEPTAIKTRPSPHPLKEKEWHDIYWIVFKESLMNNVSDFYGACRKDDSFHSSGASDKSGSNLARLFEDANNLQSIPKALRDRISKRKQGDNKELEHQVEDAMDMFEGIWKEAFSDNNVAILKIFQEKCEKEKPSKALSRLTQELSEKKANDDGKTRVSDDGSVALQIVDEAKSAPRVLLEFKE